MRCMFEHFAFIARVEYKQVLETKLGNELRITKFSNSPPEHRGHHQLVLVRTSDPKYWR